MREDIDHDDLDVISPEEMPEDAQAIQVGYVIGDDDVIGIAENSPLAERIKGDE